MNRPAAQAHTPKYPGDVPGKWKVEAMDACLAVSLNGARVSPTIAIAGCVQDYLNGREQRTIAALVAALRSMLDRYGEYDLPAPPCVIQARAALAAAGEA